MFRNIFNEVRFFIADIRYFFRAPSIASRKNGKGRQGLENWRVMTNRWLDQRPKREDFGLSPRTPKV